MARTPRVVVGVRTAEMLLRIALVLPLVAYTSSGFAQDSSAGEKCPTVRYLDWGGNISELSMQDSNYFWDYTRSHDANAPQTWKSAYGTDARCKIYGANLKTALAAGQKYNSLLSDTDPNSACQSLQGAEQHACYKKAMADLTGSRAAGVVADLGQHNQDYANQIKANLQGLENKLGLSPEQVKKEEAKQAAAIESANAKIADSRAASAASSVAATSDQAGALAKTFDNNQAKGAGPAGAGAAASASVGNGTGAGGVLSTPDSRYAAMGGGEAPPAPVEKSEGNFFSNLFGGKSAVDKANDKVKDDNSQLEDNNDAIRDLRADYKKNLDESKPLADQAAKDKQAADQAAAAYQKVADANAHAANPKDVNEDEAHRLKQQWESAAEKQKDSEQALAKVQSKMDKDYNDYLGHVASNQKVLDDISKDTYTRDTRRQMADRDAQNTSLMQENARLENQRKAEPERAAEIDQQLARNNAQINANNDQNHAASVAWSTKYGATAAAAQPPTGEAFARQLPPGSLVRTESATALPAGDWRQTYKVTPPSGGQPYEMVMSQHKDPATGQITERQEFSLPPGDNGKPPFQQGQLDAVIQQHLPPGTVMRAQGGSANSSGDWEQTYRMTPPGRAPGAGDYEVKVTQQKDPATGKWVLQQQISPLPPALTQNSADPVKPTPRYAPGPKPQSVANQPYYYQGDISAQQAPPATKNYAKSWINSGQPSPTATPAEKSFQAAAQKQQQLAKPDDQKAQDEKILLMGCAQASSIADYCSSGINNILDPVRCANQPNQSFWTECGNARRDLKIKS